MKVSDHVTPLRSHCIHYHEILSVNTQLPGFLIAHNYYITNKTLIYSLFSFCQLQIIQVATHVAELCIKQKQPQSITWVQKNLPVVRIFR